jgi:hypothetical protein
MDKHISVQEAEVLQDRYIITRSNVIDSSLGYEDVRNFNFSLDEMKNYIQEIEDYASIHGQQNLGITIFMGAYETTSQEDSKTTVFLAGSRDNGDGVIKEINPLNFAKPGNSDF